MTILNCTATKCIYNDHELCSRGDIEIIGNGARKADETSCGSFKDRECGCASNSTGDRRHCGCEKINVDCKAQNCSYNEHCRCTAAAIDISGCGAGNCNDTKCSTFACQC